MPETAALRVWATPTRYHETETCAGDRGFRSFLAYAADAGLEPCGVCCTSFSTAEAEEVAG